MAGLLLQMASLDLLNGVCGEVEGATGVWEAASKALTL